MSYDMEMTFLVVDDDSQVRDIIVQYLKSFGFTNIIEAKDGNVGLKFVRNPSQVIDFIISDWEMPKRDGLTLLRAVRKEVYRKGTKFLMVTSQGSHERMKITKAAKARVDGYMVKSHAGQSIVLPAWRLTELLDDPEFVMARKERFRRRVEANNARPVEKHSATEGDNELTRSGFEEALQKASKKVSEPQSKEPKTSSR